MPTPELTLHYSVSSGGESGLYVHPLHLRTATRGFSARFKLQPASNHHLRTSVGPWLACEGESGGTCGKHAVSGQKSCQGWEVCRRDCVRMKRRHPWRVACAAARQLQVHRRRVQACVQGKKSQTGSIGSRRTIKNSRRKCAAKSRPGQSARSQREGSTRGGRGRIARVRLRGVRGRVQP